MTKETEKKVKVTEREIVREALAKLLLAEFGLNELKRTKEGLVLEVNGETVVVRTILKKEAVKTGDVIEVITG